ncbi:hypothetical protein IMZ31_22120 (plasmid) [Pontibacillus sp. ALD_SL1]|uniref:hypothetical protein n=1 Tax=Pontibacillus sp. ALD_SL1 TaxID=2777185 RepID=UPI001A95F3F7|nr:hypothetical protein [Pontibacillus sp. ALD_SL1]QST02151.1 hypothetical protein IMZ31_22120 [Pontibacillus sp. ALD_SL1]
MNFEINPYVGAGRIKFGMTGKQVQEILQIEPQKFSKTPLCDELTDAYPFCHVFYKGNGNCEAIEFFGPAGVTIQGNTLIGKPYEKVSSLFKELDRTLEEDEVGFISYKYGISVYSSDLQRVEGVLAFEEGYYD